MNIRPFSILIISIFAIFSSNFQISQLDPSKYLASQIDGIVQDRNLKGIQIQIRKNDQKIFYHHNEIKNQRNQSIDQNTIFRVASISKSLCSVVIMQLVQQKKLKLSDSVSDILGFDFKNPYYPDIVITIEMLLSHHSSLSQSDSQFFPFLDATYNSTNGSSVPSLKQILLPGGKFYNTNIFPQNKKPGEYFQYSNLGYIVAGTIIQIVTQKRFDIYLAQTLLPYISEGLIQTATFNPATIKDYKNLAAIYIGDKGKWVPNFDNYSNKIPQRDLSQYKIGTNSGIYAPHSGLRASVKHLNNYMYIFMNKGVSRSGKRILSQESVNEILKNRYQYHGVGSGAKKGFHLYGLGMYITSYSLSDIVIEHEVLRGHTGSKYGLISVYYFWKNYSFSYIVNGALNDYEDDPNSIYQVERQLIHKSINNFINRIEVDQI